MGIYGPAIVVVNLILLVSGKTSELIIFFSYIFKDVSVFFLYTTSAAVFLCISPLPLFGVSLRYSAISGGNPTTTSFLWASERPY
jgi:hypothetical protein